MTRLRFDWVDAFSDRPFGGNGCAVLHDAGDLDADTCMAFVRETSLVECTFTEPSDIADVKVRYFLASQEIPFAGHPTIATVAAMRSRGLISGDRLTLETGAGLVPVRLDGDSIEMTQIAPQFGAAVSKDAVARAISLPTEAIIATPQVVSTGLPFCIVVLRDHDALKAARLNPDGLPALGGGRGGDPEKFLLPYMVTLTGATAPGDTFSRLLMTPPSPAEDPFTGSATGAMAAYLWHHGLMAKDSFTAEQGHWLGRPGQAQVTRLGPSDAMTGIAVSGRGHVLMSGEVNLDSAAR